MIWTKQMDVPFQPYLQLFEILHEPKWKVDVEVDPSKSSAVASLWAINEQLSGKQRARAKK